MVTVLLAVMVAVTAPKIDGVIDEAEWRNAAVYDGMVSVKKGENFPLKTTTWVDADKEKIYVAVRSEVPSVGLLNRVMPKRGGAFAYIDDCVVLKFAGRRALLVNARGAVTEVNGESGITNNFICASTVTNGFWNFECSLPVAEAGDLEKFDVGRRWPQADDTYGVGAFVALKERSPVPAADSPRVQVLGVEGGTAAYTVKLRVVNPAKTAAKVSVEAAGHPENSQTAVLRRTVELAPGGSEELTMKGPILEDEFIGFELAAKSADGKLDFTRKTVMRPNYAGSPFVKTGNDADLVAYKYAYYPSYNKFRARVDVVLVPDYRNAVKGVKCQLFDTKGVEVFAKTILPNAEGIADETFDVPDLRPLTVKSGNPEYRLRLTVEGLKDVFHEKKIYRHAMEWEGNRYGRSAIVVPPFTAMKAKEVEAGGRQWTVSTVLRKHELNGLGLFRQVWCPAKEGDVEPVRPILAGKGVRLLATVDGKEFEVEGSLKAVKGEGGEEYDAVRRAFRSEFDAHGLKGFVDVNFEYDGHVNWDLTLERGKVDFLRLEMPYLAKEATHMHAMPCLLRHSYGGLVPAGEGLVWDGSKLTYRNGLLGDVLCYAWIGGTLRGLSVYCENDKGWVWGKGRCHEVYRDADGTVRMVLNLVQRPFEFSGPRKIRLGFMATPVKPMLPHFRGYGPGLLLGSGLQWGAGPQDADVQPFDGTTAFWTEMSRLRDGGKYSQQYVEDSLGRLRLPGKPGEKAYEETRSRVKVHWQSGLRISERSRRTVDFVGYTNARGVDFGIPSGATYCDQWSRWEFMDMDRDFNCMSKRDYDLDPDAAFQDYAGWWYRLACRTGALDSLYWDDIYLQPNFDLVGTDAYRLEDGRIQPATGVNNMRGLVKRCATVQAEEGLNCTNNWIHMTDTSIAPISAFAGVHFDMEDSPTGGKAFQQFYPMEYLEALSIGRQMGCRVKCIAHYPSTTKEKDAWYERTGAGLMLCYEFYWKWNAWVFNGVMKKLVEWGYRRPDTKVYNYWNKDDHYPLELTGPKGASIVMAREGEAIVVVSDFSGVENAVYSVKPDAKHLGIRPGTKAYDFETGTEIAGTKEGKAEFTLKPYDFKVVIFK